MKGSLCPRETFHNEDFNGNKNSAEKRILRSLMTWQRFITGVGTFWQNSRFLLTARFYIYTDYTLVVRMFF